MCVNVFLKTKCASINQHLVCWLCFDFLASCPGAGRMRLVEKESFAAAAAAPPPPSSSLKKGNKALL
jgi:hypothetical protein